MKSQQLQINGGIDKRDFPAGAINLEYNWTAAPGFVMMQSQTSENKEVEQEDSIKEI